MSFIQKIAQIIMKEYYYKKLSMLRLIKLFNTENVIKDLCNLDKFVLKYMLLRYYCNTNCLFIYVFFNFFSQPLHLVLYVYCKISSLVNKLPPHVIHVLY